jgi:hypothetical protein
VLQQDTVRRQLDHVLSSAAFRNSTSLRRLLEYLTERTLHGDAQDLKEYRIGVEGLGKHESYDPRIDPSVRVQVGRLRSRLAEYYLDEGALDPITISVPKGGFFVVFEERRAEPAAEGRDPVPPVAWPSRIRLKAIVIMALGLLGTVFFFVSSDKPVARSSSANAFQDLWKPYLSSPQPILISMGIPMWIRFTARAPDGSPLAGDLRDSSLNEWPPSGESADGRRVELWRKQLQAEALEPRYHYVAVGEAMATATLSQAFGHHSNPTIVRSNLLSWDNVNGANVIFVGAPKFSPHFRNAPFIQNFRIGSFEVANLHPRPGEKAAYPDGPRGTDRQGAALVGRYRNPGGGWLTLIGSANSLCTWAAVEYLTRPDYVAKLNEALRRPSGKIPDSFEVVIEASFDQSSPIEIHHTAIRELPTPR